MSYNTEKLIVFSAPSGSGKTTIVKHLLEQSDLPLAFSISATTRAPRGNEKDGVDYYFLSKEEFEQRIQEGAFLEYEEVYPGLFYGTLTSEIERLWASGKAVLFDIDVMGGLAVKKNYPERTLTVFVKPPSVEVLEQRLRNRNTDSEETLRIRIAKSASELEKASAFDQILINDQLEEALGLAEALVIDFLKQ